MEDQNPYHAIDPEAIGMDESLGPLQGHRRGMFGHVSIVSVLMIIQGVLNLVYGGFMAIAAAFLPAPMTEALAENPQFQQNNGLDPDSMATIYTISFAVIGGISLLLGLLLVSAGICTYRLKGRIFAIVTLCLGLLSVLGCYCAPTAIGLAVYGLVVLMNDSVRSAFAWRQQGYSVAELRHLFARLPK